MTDTTSTTNTTKPADPVPLAIQQLAEYGLSPETLAMAFSMDIREVRASLTTFRLPTPEDNELADSVRKLASLAVKKAAFLLEFGSTDVQVSLIKSVLTGTVRLAGATSAGELAETRSALEVMFGEMRSVTPQTTIVTDDPDREFVDVTAKALTETTDDQDD